MLKKILKKNYKLVLGIIVGLTISTVVAYATTLYEGSVISYDNTNSSLSSTDVQGALDELYEVCSASSCTGSASSCLRLGDYVSMTPTVSSYTTDTTYTGYTSTQTINPQELNLWRVISINDDGTVDIISEYVSSVAIYFNGITGFKNLVGYLNVLASQYENSSYTSGSRYFGYNGQTEFLSSYCTSTSCSDESRGAGDALYTTDSTLVKNVLGTLVAKNVSTGSNGAYWVASRLWKYFSSTYPYSMSVGRSFSTSGTITDKTLIRKCFSQSTSNNCYGFCSNTSMCLVSSAEYLRPIVTLKSDLIYTREGKVTISEG